MRETFKSMIFVTFTHYTVQKVLKLQTATTDSHIHMSNAYCLRDPLHQPFYTHYRQSCHFKHAPNPLRTNSQMQQCLRLDLIGFFFFQVCSVWTI